MSFRATLLAGLAGVLLFAAPAAAEVPSNATWSEHYIETPGHPRLHVDVLLPKGLEPGAKVPLIVSVGPYFAHLASALTDPTPTNDGPQLRWRDLIERGGLFERGYGLVQVDLRGFGASSGCNDFGGKGEQADVERAIEWAARQPFSTGKVAHYGKSYDGWTGVMALDSKPDGLAAAIIQAPIIDGYRTLYQDGLHYGPGWWYTPALYQAIDLTPPSTGAAQRPEYVKGFATGTDPACYAQNIALQNTTQEWNTPFWRERDLDDARGADIPTFWSHGFVDVNTKPDNFLPVWSTLDGPKRAWFGQFAHRRPNDSQVGRNAYYWEELFAFLGEHVEGKARQEFPHVEVEDSLGRWRAERQWPPKDAKPAAMGILAGGYDDRPNGASSWSVTAPVPHTVWLSGVPTAKVDVTTTVPGATLITKLYDIGPDGRGTLITRGGGKVRGSGQSSKDVELYPQDWVLEEGHRLGLLTTGADINHYTPAHTAQAVTVRGGTLTMPFLRTDRTTFLEGDESSDGRSWRSNSGNRATPPAAALATPAPFDVPPPLEQD